MIMTSYVDVICPPIMTAYTDFLGLWFCMLMFVWKKIHMMMTSCADADFLISRVPTMIIAFVDNTFLQ